MLFQGEGSSPQYLVVASGHRCLCHDLLSLAVIFILFLKLVFPSTFVSKARLLHHVGQSDSSQEERVGCSLDLMIKLSRLLLAYPTQEAGLAMNI